ncbi:MAG: hypothetical protein Fur0037_06270 [Planctomycetota bacterium]
MKIAMLFLSLLFAAPALAQRTWVVDMRGGTGVDFLDLPPAVAAAAPGDTILLIDGLTTPPNYVYHATVIDKPLRILGVSEWGAPAQPLGPTVRGRFEIRNIAQGSEVLLANLNLTQEIWTIPPGVIPPHGLVGLNCAGRVHLQYVGYNGGYPYNGEFRFENCSDVWMDWCWIVQPGPSIVFRNSNVSIYESQFVPYPYVGFIVCPFPTLPCTDWTSSTIVVDNSTVRFVDSIVHGADEMQSNSHGTQVARLAVEILSGTVTVGPSTRLYGGIVNSSPSYPLQAIGSSAAGTAILDWRSYTTGVYQTTVIHRATDAVLTQKLEQNQPFELMVTGTPTGFALVVMGFPMAQPISLSMGELLLDPSAWTVMALTTIGNNGFSPSLPFAVPAGAPMDMIFGFQAATLGASLGLTTPTLVSIVWEGGRTWP